MTASVKGCGCRPYAIVGTGSVAGVGKPPRKEPAGGLALLCSGRYGDLVAAGLIVSIEWCWAIGQLPLVGRIFAGFDLNRRAVSHC
jgi:hypothetical protein